jgi:excisionase family DNA binding protein
MSPTDPLFRPKTLYHGRTTTTGRVVSEERRVRSADEEHAAKAAGWVENEQVAMEAAASAHWAQEDATNRAQWAQQAAATRAQREQQDQARHAADRRHADLIEQAIAKALKATGRQPDTGAAPTVPLEADGAPRRAFFTVKEAATYLHVSEKNIRRRIGDGELPARKVGRTLRISGSDLAAYQRHHPSRT